MPDDLLKAGEFAHLCGTTKETLRHYKDIGLLMPVAKAENGYIYEYGRWKFPYAPRVSCGASCHASA